MVQITMDGNLDYLVLFKNCAKMMQVKLSPKPNYQNQRKQSTFCNIAYAAYNDNNILSLISILF